MSPEVSIVMPVYRGGAYVAATLRSIQEQVFGDFEVLCIDDCSDDSSAEIIRSLSSKDDRLRYIRTPTNLGNVPRVLSTNLGETRGRFFVYTSQDDSFSPDWLSSMVEVANRTGAEAVVPDLVFHDEVRGESRWLRNSDRPPLSGTEAFLLSLDWTIPGNALWRRSLYERFGFYDFGMYADEYSWRVYLLHSRQVAFAPGVFRYYQGNQDAITRKLSAGMLDRVLNDYLLWQLVEEHAPQSSWTSRYAQHGYRSLRYALALIEEQPLLFAAKGRLDQGFARMASDPVFRKRLRESYSSRIVGGLAELSLEHPLLLRLAARINRLRGAGR